MGHYQRHKFLSIFIDETAIKIFTRLILMKYIFEVIKNDRNLTFNLSASQQWFRVQIQLLKEILNRELAFRQITYNGMSINSMNDLAAYRVKTNDQIQTNKFMGCILLTIVFSMKVADKLSNSKNKSSYGLYLLCMIAAILIMKSLTTDVVRTRQNLQFFNRHVQAGNALAEDNNIQRFVLISNNELEQAFAHRFELEGDARPVDSAKAALHQNFVLK